jgi:hypothetical protein
MHLTECLGVRREVQVAGSVAHLDDRGRLVEPVRLLRESSLVAGQICQIPLGFPPPQSAFPLAAWVKTSSAKATAEMRTSSIRARAGSAGLWLK